MSLKKKSDQINSQLLDLKAEFVVSTLLDEGFSLRDIQIILDGDIKRKWSKDIDKTKLEEFEDSSTALSFHLNRSGIYDALPEALFHEMEDDKNATGETMAKDSVRLKKEERQSRLFFRPFENELFFKSVDQSTIENQYFEKLFEHNINGLVPDFWRLEKGISGKYRLKLEKMIPFAHQIIGKKDLTCEALTFILNEKVSISNDYNDFAVKKPGMNKNMNVLGKGKLGSDFVIGNAVSGFIARQIINIGPIKNSSLQNFMGEGDAVKLINTFIDYFFPMEYDVDFRVFLEENDGQFIFSDEKDKQPVLGMSSII